LPKKIEFDLLLADLALEFGDPLARRIRRRDGRVGVLRTTLAGAAFGGRPRPRSASGPPDRNRSRQT